MLRDFNSGRLLPALLVALTLSACGSAQLAGGVHDPLEPQNRRIHEFNRQVDKSLLRPASTAYGGVLPQPVRNGVGNFASNISVPGAILNDLLQLNIGDALHNSARLLINTTLGLGGIMDPATDAGLPERDSDFGETLHVWGFGEGAYLELPFAGPSTTRDTVGMTVDLFIDPINTLFPAPERYVAPIAAVTSKVGDRYRFRGTVDSILYESADSYIQARLLYLENRRFELGVEEENEEDLYDLYEEAFE